MRLFNTLTNKKEEFKPIEEGKVSIYICGPTVYNHAHIGNTRPMIVFDVLRRTFEYLGNDVTFVSNYTDVDDKIIKAAKAEGITEKELTDKYIKAYEDVRAGLNIEDPTYKPRVTETMPEIINFIQALIDKGYAYEVDGDVYFRVTKVKEYGMLSGIKVEDLIAGAVIVLFLLMIRRKKVQLTSHYGRKQMKVFSLIHLGQKVDQDGILNVLS